VPGGAPPGEGMPVEELDRPNPETVCPLYPRRRTMKLRGDRRGDGRGGGIGGVKELDRTKTETFCQLHAKTQGL